MKTPTELQFRRDLLKLACLTAAVVGTVAVFMVTPALSGPTFLSIVATMILSPWVDALERRGYSRSLAIAFIFIILGIILGLASFSGFQAGSSQWSSFKTQAPEHFNAAIQKLRKLESDLKSHFPFLNSLHPTDSLLKWGQDTGKWFVDHGPTLMGEFLTWIFIIPPLCFVLLNEGRMIRRRFFLLVPNRLFESFFLITTDISNAISDYIRAKLIEALLVGLMVTIGLAILGRPYSIVLGITAGITNIIPYLGPFLGALPAIFIVAFESQKSGMLLPVSLVYIIANLIDTIVIFPLVVAKLVKLHPLLLIAVVAVGQEYYGLVGMLISIPMATALKVVLQEIYLIVYESRPKKSNPKH
jgi:putative permease